MVGALIGLAAFAALAAFVVNFLTADRTFIPSHLLGHPSAWMANIIGPREFEEINQIMRDFKEFPTNINAGLKHVNFTMKHEHIGEGVPVGPDGRCNDPYLVPSLDGSLCVFPMRVDIGRHFVLTGGPDAIREPMEDMVSRVSSFSRYIFNAVNDYPSLKRLFETPEFKATAVSICPADQQVLDPFQFSFVLQVPGQSVPLHTDSPYFWGANRRQFPEWLLACMVFSGLFRDKFINQVQGVGYLHDWKSLPDKFDTQFNPNDPNSLPSSSTGGDFVYYDSNTEIPKTIVPVSRAASFIDGSKSIHAAKVFRLGTKAPMLDKSKNCSLVYRGKNADGAETEQWDLVVNGETTAVYPSSDVRMTLVFRARCFATEELVKKFYAQTDDDVMPLDYILDRLKSGMQKDQETVPEEIRSKSMIKNGKKYTRKELDELNRYDLGMAFMNYYLQLPLPPKQVTWMPYNYCALSGIFPITRPLLKPFCE